MHPASAPSPPPLEQGAWPVAPAPSLVPWQADRTGGFHAAAQRVLPLAMGYGEIGVGKVTEDRSPARIDDDPDDRPCIYTDAAATRPTALA